LTRIDISSSKETAVSNRREFLSYGGILAASGLGLHEPSAFAGTKGPRFKAACFDAFTIFDPRTLDEAIEREAPGQGVQLANAWRARLFDYCWLRTLYGRYADFNQLTQESLDVVLRTSKTALPDAARARILSAWLELKPYPDSVEALRAMHSRGTRLAYLSNLTPLMLDTNSKRLGVRDLFEFLLTTETIQAYKPHPKAYAMGETSFALPKSEILFVAFGGWDAGGARSFGLPTVWVNRFGVVPERLGVEPDKTVATLREVADFLAA
jgi:2-haloacid dehalogenase